MRPQLATLADRVPAGDQWLHEIKFDGYRLMCYVMQGRVRLMTRRGLDWTSKFREVADAIAALPVEDAILDGELIALDSTGRSTFNAMQNALRVGTSRRLQLHLFDLPYINGFDLRRTPLVERKALLEQVLASARRSAVLHFSDHVVGHGDRMFQQACEQGLEGTISKRVESPYVSSRTSSWLKNKCKHRQEFIIGGYSEPEGSRTGFGALVVGYYDNKRLIYAGRVGTGFSSATLKSLYARLRANELARTSFDVPPTGAEAKGVHWVKPVLVAEVEFSNWTDDGRLRHPAFLGLREDKAADKVVRETPVHVASASAPKPQPPSRNRSTSDAGSVAGVAISNPQRVMYPDAKLTKLDVARYYEAIAPRILPHIVNRPLTIVRCPKGLPSKCFYQRHLTETLPAALRGVNVLEKGQVYQYIVVDDLEGLISLVQHSTLEFHPWGSRADDLDRPDRLVFDLDPGPDVSWQRVREAALRTRDVLAAAKLKSFVQTSGGKGLHVVVPIVPRANWEEARSFCQAVAQFMAAQEPSRYTAILSKSKRTGKIFIDYLRNSRGATSVAPYSTRARPGAKVATPIRWDELPKIRGADVFDVRDVSRRVGRGSRDPWEDYFDVRKDLPKVATPAKPLVP